MTGKRAKRSALKAAPYCGLYLKRSISLAEGWPHIGSRYRRTVFDPSAPITLAKAREPLKADIASKLWPRFSEGGLAAGRPGFPVSSA